MLDNIIGTDYHLFCWEGFGGGFTSEQGASLDQWFENVLRESAVELGH
jgi:hypothetical protein